jgi:CRISPR/Cas system CMR-associated protein Cmr5 small subunit
MNLEQIRAGRAFKVAEAAAQGNHGDDFLALGRELPTMLQRNGLLATWSFLLSKRKSGEGEKAPALALNALLSHLSASEIGLVAPPARDALALFRDQWTSRDSSLSGLELRRLTAEALLFAGWLKRAAETLCGSGKEGAS